MSKIQDLERVIKAGARNNKYRVHFPVFGEQMDIQVHDISAPGRGLGVAEVYLKGRKYQIAGDRGDDDSTTITFYNDPNLKLRRFFLQAISDIQSYGSPAGISSYESAPSAFTLRDQNNEFNLSSLLGKDAEVVEDIMDKYDQIKYNLGALSKISDNPRRTRRSQSGSAAWYQYDIIIEQMDHNDQPISQTILHNAFVTNVSPLEYQDEIGDISTTQLTIAYTSTSAGTAAAQKVLGDTY